MARLRTKQGEKQQDGYEWTASNPTRHPANGYSSPKAIKGGIYTFGCRRDCQYRYGDKREECGTYDLNGNMVILTVKTCGAGANSSTLVVKRAYSISDNRLTNEHKTVYIRQ